MHYLRASRKTHSALKSGPNYEKKYLNTIVYCMKKALKKFRIK